MIKSRTNPPKGSYSKKFNEKWTKYYEEALEKYKDKSKAAQVAWSIIKHKFEKSEKSGKWIPKKKKK
jgi:cation transport regulator ChaB